MSVELKLLSVIWVLASVRGDIAENPKVIKIATIIPRDRSRLFSIERVRPALEIANEKVRSMGLLPHHNITVNFADSECSIEIGTYMKGEGALLCESHTGETPAGTRGVGGGGAYFRYNKQRKVSGREVRGILYNV